MPSWTMASIRAWPNAPRDCRSEEHTSELQSLRQLVCRLLLEKKKKVFGKAIEPRIIQRIWAFVGPFRRWLLVSVWAVLAFTFTNLAFPLIFFFFFNDTATTEIYTLSLHDALPIYTNGLVRIRNTHTQTTLRIAERRSEEHTSDSSHLGISYAVFCLKKKKKHTTKRQRGTHDSRKNIKRANKYKG